MSINLAPGELYFIREMDAKTGRFTPFTKVGLVRDHDRRTTLDRVREHQTGNPRQLVVHHVITSPAIDGLETLFHNAFARSRISGEWFVFDDSGLDDAVGLAKERSRQVTRAREGIKTVQTLATKVSTTAVVAATAASRKLARRIAELRAQDAASRALDKVVTAVFSDAREAGADVSRFFDVIERAPRSSFDQDAFAVAHPKLMKKYLSTGTRIASRVAVAGAAATKLPVADVNAELAGLVAAAEKIAGRSRLSVKDAAALHETNLRSLEVRAVAAWDLELLMNEACLLCGKAGSVEDPVKWSRTKTVTEGLDTAALRADHPETYAKFMVPGKASTARMVRRDQGFVL